MERTLLLGETARRPLIAIESSSSSDKYTGKKREASWATSSLGLQLINIAKVTYQSRVYIFMSQVLMIQLGCVFVALVFIYYGGLAYAPDVMRNCLRIRTQLREKSLRNILSAGNSLELEQKHFASTVKSSQDRLRMAQRGNENLRVC
jgi:hypothetical protein